MSKRRRPYTPEYRRLIVELVRTGRTPSELARVFECSASAIRNWVRKAGRDEGRREDGPTPDGTGERRMLTDEQRTGIRLEEAYRSEVRDALSAGRPKGVLARFWTFLNANVVVWFLGSVVATGIVISVDGRDQRRAAEELQQKLDTEIAVRVYRARGYLEKMEGSKATVLNVAGVLRGIGPVHDQPYPMGVFSEFDDRTLESLLWELATTLEGGERDKIMAAMNAARTLRDIEAEIETHMERITELKCRFILRIYEELDGAFGLDRWKISSSEPVVADASETGGCIPSGASLIGRSVTKEPPKAPKQ